MTATDADIAAAIAELATAPPETLSFLCWVSAIGAAHGARRHGLDNVGTRDFRRIVEAMVLVDAAIRPYAYDDTSESDVLLDPNPLADASDAFAVLQWAWQIDAGGDPPAPRITDPVVRAWAARRAAAQVERRWAMRLLAQLGADP